MNNKTTYSLLLIEDDLRKTASWIRSIEPKLADAFGITFQLVTTSELSAAYQIIEQQEITIILLDVALISLLNAQTLAKVFEQMKDLPVVMLSDSNHEETVLDAVRLGAQDYLPKSDLDVKLFAYTMRHTLERHRLIKKTRADEANVRRMIEQNVDSILIIDESGTIQYVNPAACNLFGRPQAYLIGADFGFPVNADRASEIEILRKDGSICVAELRASAFSWQDNPAYLATLRDITEQKEGRQQIATLLQQTQAQAALGQEILDTMPEGVLVIDHNHRLFLTNPQALLALPVLRNMDTTQPLSDLQGFPLTEIIAKTTSENAWYELTLDNPSRILELAAQPLTTEPLLDGWVVVIRDVTEERSRQQTYQIQQRLATVGQLAAGIAHDFNNVMAAILLYTQFVEKGENLTDKQLQHLAIIRDQSQHAVRLIRQILDFSRKSVMEIQTINFLYLMTDSFKLLQHTLPDNIHMHLTSDGKQYQIQGDPARLQQILFNLAINARDAMPDGGDLTFALSAVTVTQSSTDPHGLLPGKWMKLTVTDTGMGIPQQNVPRIFEPFYTTKATGQGTGLGLSQVYGIIQQHKGAITATSTEGKGTAFTIYLPIMVAEPPKAPNNIESKKHLGKGETILVVEDNDATRDAVCDILEGQGYQVLTAADGMKALAILAEEAKYVDLILSDMVMPIMGGLELHRVVRARHPHIKTIIMSGYPLKEDEHSLLSEGIVEWIEKPFSVEDITETIAAVLKMARASEIET